jgi:hypothetical protein
MPTGPEVVTKTSIIPTDLVVGAAIFYIVAALFAGAVVPPTGGNWASTFKAVGAALGIAAAIFAPISAIVLARYQAQLTRDLGTEIERLKNALSAGLEVRKALITGRASSFNTLLSAAHFFYYALRQFTNSGDSESENLVREARKRLAEASAAVWYLSSDDKLKWYKVAQHLSSLGGELNKVSVSERRQLFDSRVGEIGEAMHQLEQAGLAVLNETAQPDLALLARPVAR